ncbi:MAG: hypothetical protein IM638_18890 [Bacteroidetes bacterium]|nr:hypothetical protein [Bacteroidota bacterium]
MKTDLELLTTLQRAEISPYVWTRIQARIATRVQMNMKPALAWTMLGAAVVLLAVNVALVAFPAQKNYSESASGLSSTSNYLYNE